ncbi:hypothetical protein [Streptomyces sp. NPDC026589]|uniref:hypothetical protein n=1 Tax=Streptomyces sp. NPDC026589 TaxID=3155609 RepID=UPI0033E13BEC
MKDLIAALDALTDRDPNRRDVAAAVLGDLLRGTALDTDTACLTVGRLVGLAVDEPETRRGIWRAGSPGVSTYGGELPWASHSGNA